MTLVQPDLLWLDPQANLKHLSTLLSQKISDKTDIIVLPEMFTSGFTQNPEPLYGNQSTIQWMKEQASDYRAAVVGSIACEISATEKSPNEFVNRLLFITPEGQVFHYDKCHLFQMGGEHKRYTAGSERRVIDYKGWRILLTICYDLRFPVFCRNGSDYDMMLCVANWPESRRQPWRSLLQARAIENQSYVVGVNRVGTDGNGLQYSGDSMIVDFWGKILSDAPVGQECLLSTTLSKDTLLLARKSFPVLKDADSFKLL